MHTATSWFRSDPRRLCVAGVWLSLAGLAVTFSSLIAGLPVAGLLAGVVLSASGCWAKVAGRDQFRRARRQRVRVVVLAPPHASALPSTSA